MGRNKLPLNIHVLKGTAKKHPGRMKKRENEPVNTNPIGLPPRCLNKVQKQFFKEIVNSSIPGVLGQSDRIAVEMAARLLYRIRGLEIVDDELIEASASDHSLFNNYLGKFGMIPSERSKISMEPLKKKSVYDD